MRNLSGLHAVPVFVFRGRVSSASDCRIEEDGMLQRNLPNPSPASAAPVQDDGPLWPFCPELLQRADHPWIHSHPVVATNGYQEVIHAERKSIHQFTVPPNPATGRGQEHQNWQGPIVVGPCMPREFREGPLGKALQAWLLRHCGGGWCSCMVRQKAIRWWSWRRQ